MNRLTTDEQICEYYSNMMDELQAEHDNIIKDRRLMRDGGYGTKGATSNSLLYSFKETRMREINSTMDDIARLAAPKKPSVKYVNKLSDCDRNAVVAKNTDPYYRTATDEIAKRSFIYPIIFKTTGNWDKDQEALDKVCTHLEKTFAFAGRRNFQTCRSRKGKISHIWTKVLAYSYLPMSADGKKHLYKAGNYILNVCISVKCTKDEFDEILVTVAKMIRKSKLPKEYTTKDPSLWEWPFTSFGGEDAIQAILE